MTKENPLQSIKKYNIVDAVNRMKRRYTKARGTNLHWYVRFIQKATD